MKKILLFLSLVAPILLQAQTIAIKADELLRAYTDQNKFSGVVLIAVKDSVVFNKAYGYANRDTKQPATVETEFRAGSLTKMFTSTLILRLVQQHKLSLTDPVSKYVPAFPNGEQITLKHLLSHTSGIRGNTPQSATSLTQMVAGFKGDSLAFKPGEKFEYNNFNYFLLSYIAQKVTGKPYPVLLQNEVLHKAGMQYSGLDVDDRKSANKALGYVTNPATNQWVQTGIHERANLASGAGALYTTTGDLLEWSKTVTRETLLPKKMYNLLFTPVQPGYGLGWMISSPHGHVKLGHTGSIPGFIADFMLFPKDSITVIFLSNYQDLDGRQLDENLTALVLGQPYELPKQKHEVVLTEDSLRTYVGTYEQSPNVRMIVQLENGKLNVIAPGGDKVELTAEAADKFFLKGPEIEVAFERADGAVATMVVFMQGRQVFKKVK